MDGWGLPQRVLLSGHAMVLRLVSVPASSPSFPQYLQHVCQPRPYDAYNKHSSLSNPSECTLFDPALHRNFMQSTKMQAANLRLLCWKHAVGWICSLGKRQLHVWRQPHEPPCLDLGRAAHPAA